MPPTTVPVTIAANVGTAMKKWFRGQVWQERRSQQGWRGPFFALDCPCGEGGWWWELWGFWFRLRHFFISIYEFFSTIADCNKSGDILNASIIPVQHSGGYSPPVDLRTIRLEGWPAFFARVLFLIPILWRVWWRRLFPSQMLAGWWL